LLKAFRVELFKITCVTCQARLSVRNASAIGQILACPRCGSMVQVVAPASAPGVRAATPVAGASIAAAVPPPVPASALETFADVADFGAELGAESEVALPAVTNAGARASGAAAASAGWSMTHLVAMAAASALVGSALVAGVLALLNGDRDAPAVGQADVAESGALHAAKLPTAPADDAIDIEESDLGAPEADQARTEVDVPAHGVAEDSNPFALPVGQTAGANADSTNATLPSPAPPEAPAAMPDDAAPANAPPDEAVSASPRLRIDPLDFDPEGLDLTTLLHGDGADALAMSDLDQPAPEAVESEAPAAGAPAEPAPAALEAVQRAEEAAAPAGPAVLLARRIPAVKVKEMPLAQFLNFATSLSAVPVSVAPEELRLAAASASAPISVDAKEATIEQILTAALKPLRLAPNAEGGQIVLQRVLTGGRRELAYPVDDLIDDDGRELAAWVREFVAPESWKSAGGAGELTIEAGSLRVDHVERVGFETLLFLERYRIAQGLAPRSKYPAALLAARSMSEELTQRLSAPTTFTFSRPTSVAEVFGWWQDEMGAAVLVDWPALAEQRLTPHSRVTASVVNQPWTDALAAVLEPLGLGWRTVDSRTIEITSLATLRTQPVLELYRLESDGADVLARVKQLEVEAGASAGAGVYDAKRRVLIVRAPSAIQARLAEWLAGEGRLADAAK
jgi:hypothetical protein